MRKFRFGDEPKKFERSDYHRSIDRIVHQLGSNQAILSIYQIGGIRTPGISDVDLVVVFKNDTNFLANPLQNLSSSDRYFFIHNLFGTSEAYFKRIAKLDYLIGYQHLWGKTINRPQNDNDDAVLKTQVALEYLVKMFVNNTVQEASGVIDIRGLLLHAKALLFDFEFLDIQSGPLYEQVVQLVDWRENWFEFRPGNNQLNQWYNRFLAEFREFLAAILAERTFFLKKPHRKQLSRITFLNRAEKLETRRTGFRLPAWLLARSRLAKKVQNRIQQFEFDIPFRSENIPAILDERFNVFSEMREHNSRLIPHFDPPGSSLQAY